MQEYIGASKLALRCLLVCAATIGASLILIAPLPLDEPISWGGDTLEHAVLVDSANWLGEPGYSEETGAPYGVDWSQAPSGGERLNIAVLAVLGDLTGNIWTSINLHMLLALAATALAGFLVLRWMGVRDLIAGAVAVAFSLGAAVYDHIEQGHLFLFGLYPVPIAVFLGMRWSGWRPSRNERNVTAGDDGQLQEGPHPRRELVLSAALVLVVGLSSTYYALFAVLLISALAVAVAMRCLDWRRALPGLGCSGAIAAVVILSSAPSLLSDAPRLERRLSDSIRFALNPLRVFLPQRESVTGLTEWGSSPADAIGLLATVGALWLGWILLRHLGRGDGVVDGLLLRLGAILGISLAVGVPGGFGWLIARMGGQELRAWSRVSVFITFVGMAALAILSERALSERALSERAQPANIRAGSATRSPRYLTVAVVGIALFALLEQRSQLPERSSVHKSHQDAVAVVEDMEDSLPPGSQVLVLPAGSYLSDFGPGQVLALPLLGEELRYSAGLFRGGSGDWQLSWALEEVSTQLEAAAAGGFDAVVLQVDHHRLDDPEAMVDSIEDLLGEPQDSVGSWMWWDLAGLAGDLSAHDDSAAQIGDAALRPIGVIVEGTPGFPSSSQERDALIESRGGIRLVDHSGDDSPVIVRFEVAAAPDSLVRVSWQGFDRRTEELLEPGPGGTEVVAQVEFADAQGFIGIEFDGDPFRQGDDDPDAYAELRDIQAFDAEIADAGFAVPAALR